MKWDDLFRRRRARASRRMAVVFMERPDDWRYGSDIHRASGLRWAVMYRLLTRMLDAKQLEDGWKELEGDWGKHPAPRRRRYRPTEHGKQELTALLDTPKD